MTPIAALTAIACSEHVMEGPDPGDHTPPGIAAAVAWDVNHVVVVFDEPVTRWSADNPGYYHIAGLDLSSSPASPVAAMSVTMCSGIASRRLPHRHPDHAAMLDEPTWSWCRRVGRGMRSSEPRSASSTGRRERHHTARGYQQPHEATAISREFRHRRFLGSGPGHYRVPGFVCAGRREAGFDQYEDPLHYTRSRFCTDTRYTVLLTQWTSREHNAATSMGVRAEFIRHRYRYLVVACEPRRERRCDHRSLAHVLGADGSVFRDTAPRVSRCGAMVQRGREVRYETEGCAEDSTWSRFGPVR
jgi:hypothetical protein